MILGAEGVQIGSRFVASEESSAHINFKNAVIQSSEGDTMLTLKRLTPVRMIKNEFFNEVQRAEQNCVQKDELIKLLGKGRSKMGMFDGNLQEGELEIGQVSAGINRIQNAANIIEEIYREFKISLKEPLEKKGIFAGF